MKRFAAKELDNWLKNHNRKPMVLRGARQVGKTWLVRDLAKRQGLKLWDIGVGPRYHLEIFRLMFPK